MSTGAVRFLGDTFSPRSTAPVFVTSLANERGAKGLSPRKELTRDVGTFEAFLKKWDQPKRALYFCVATLREGVRERSKANLAELIQLHTDLDFKTIVEDPAAVEAALTGAKLPPNRIVYSGHGLHAYWWFTEPLEASEKNIARVEDLLRRLAACFAGDPAVAECSRLMRLPGSHNSKCGGWIEVTLAEARHDQGRSIEELESWLAEPTPVLRRRAQAAKATTADAAVFDDPFAAFAAEAPGVPIDVEGRLLAMAYQGPGDSAVHPTQVSCTASLLRRGMSLDDVVIKVLAATQAMADRAGLHWDWSREEADLRKMCESWLRKKPEIGVVEYEIDATESASRPSPPPPPSRTQSASLRLRPPRFEEFYALASTHSYLYVPTQDLWPTASINSIFNPVPLLDRNGQPVLDKRGDQKTISPATWLDRHRRITQLTWAPSSPQIIPDQAVAEGGWIPHAGACTFNCYRPPRLILGDAGKAGPWVDHVRKIYPTEADHIIAWLAHRVRRPGEKINHGLVLGGAPSVGKDTMLEPVRQAIGHWNMQEIIPANLMGNFNGFARNVILRISEAHDLGDLNRFQFYERLKIYMAAPPQTLRVNEKYRPEQYIFNVCGVVITTNYLTDSVYLPANDRRHFVAWSDLTQDDFEDGYWLKLWGWYYSGGYGHVAAYLAGYDLSNFKPHDPPPKTEAFWTIVSANIPSEQTELLTALERMGNPTAFTLDDLRENVIDELEDWLNDRRNRRALPHRLEACGYVPVRNPGVKKDGLWFVNRAWKAIYAKKTLTSEQRLHAAEERQKRE